MKLRIALLAVAAGFLFGACTNDGETPVSPSPPESPIYDNRFRLEAGQEGSWVAMFFLTDFTPDDQGFGEPQLRYYQVSRTGQSPEGEEGLRLSFRSYFGTKPPNLSNPFELVPLDLLSITEDAGTTYLDFTHWIGRTSTGSSGAAAMYPSFIATIRHYYPEIRRICLTVDGKSVSDSGVSIFHDTESCPLWEE